MAVSGTYMTYQCGEKRGPWNNLSSHANDNLSNSIQKEHMYLYFTMAVLWAAATLCSPRVDYVHCMGCSKCYWGTSRCHKINKSIFKKVIPLIRVSILTFISNVCRNLYCIRSQAFVSMIKVHSIVLYNHGVNFIADIHTCTCVINLIKYTKWIVLLSMCNLLYG